MGALLQLLSLPVMLMNMLGGLIGGIWLAYLGQWSVFGLGLGVFFFGAIAISFALMPGIGIAVAAGAALDRGKNVVAVPLLVLGTLWTYAVMAVWCVGAFYVVSGYYHGGSMWPYMLWSYAVARDRGPTWPKRKHNPIQIARPE
jgi:hypothetical protein